MSPPSSFTPFSSPPPRFQWATPQNELITCLSKVTDTIGTGITRGVNTHIHTHTQKEITLTLKHATFLLERGRWRGKTDKETPHRGEGESDSVRGHVHAFFFPPASVSAKSSTLLAGWRDLLLFHLCRQCEKQVIMVWSDCSQRHHQTQSGRVVWSVCVCSHQVVSAPSTAQSHWVTFHLSHH